MILTVVGARPQFVKAAVVSKALKELGLAESMVHTGQHYDDGLSKVFWQELGLPETAINLEAGSGNHGFQTAKIIEKLEAFILSLPALPTVLLLYGDTNSTLAGSIVASKLNIPIAHVEAGLRSFDKSMPEEVNRIVTDHLSSLLFCSSTEGVQNLANEGITKNVHITGDVMYDAVLQNAESAKKKIDLVERLPVSSNTFNLLTLHRPSNTDNIAVMQSLLETMGGINNNIVWPVHPRVKEKLTEIVLPSNIHITTPLSYFEMLAALSSCNKVFTDSGGLQKEAYWLRKPCITLREETEWVETKHNQWNIVCGTDPKKIMEAYSTDVDPSTWTELYGQGNAAQQIAQLIKDQYFA